MRIRNRNGDFLLRAARTQTALLWRCYTFLLLEISRRTRCWYLKCVIVYLVRDICPFVMYCVNGKPRSSLLIESTDSMIYIRRILHSSTISVGLAQARPNYYSIIHLRIELYVILYNTSYIALYIAHNKHYTTHHRHLSDTL